MGGRDALVTGGRFYLHGKFLNFVFNNGAVRKPQRKAGADKVVKGKNLEFSAQYPVVAFFGLLPLFKILREFSFSSKGCAIDASEHFILFIASPIGAGNMGKFESGGVNVFGRVFNVPAAA